MLPASAESDEEDGQASTPWQGQVAMAGVFRPPPGVSEAEEALNALRLILKPPRDGCQGYKDPGLNSLLQGWLEKMRMFLWTFVNGRCGWMEASLQTAHAFKKGPWLAGRLHQWT